MTRCSPVVPALRASIPAERSAATGVIGVGVAFEAYVPVLHLTRSAVVDTDDTMFTAASENDRIVPDEDIPQSVLTKGTIPPICLDEPYSVVVVAKGVAVDLGILRRVQKDPRSIYPSRVSVPISLYKIVADDSVVADLMKDSRTEVIADRIVLDPTVDIIDVGPDPGTAIVVNVVSSDNKVGGPYELGAASLPVGVVIVGVVVRDLVSLNQDV